LFFDVNIKFWFLIRCFNDWPFEVVNFALDCNSTNELGVCVIDGQPILLSIARTSAMSVSYESDVSLGHAIFDQAELGDKRRSDRIAETFDVMKRNPGGSLPDKLACPDDLRAFYRLCNCSEVTHESLILAIRQHTISRIAACQSRVLILHDATELDYSSLKSLIDELAQIGRGNRRGYICQNVLAVNADTGEVLGLLDQILHLRADVPKKETMEEHRNRESRESLLWLKGTKHLPADTDLIDICDQGADTFEFLEHEFKSGRRFVIRAWKPRKAYPGHVASGEKQSLKEYSKSLPELGRFMMDIQAQKGRKARKNAEFIVGGGPVLICRPHAKVGNHGNDPLPLYVLRVSEVNPPKGEKAIDWMLITNEPVKTLKDAWKITGWYERRWIVEELHKGMKTGCRIEDMQFTTVDRLKPAIALLTSVSVTLLNLRDMSRREDAKIVPAETLLDKTYVIVLCLWRYGKIKDLTIHDFFFALARLGGHQNRKSDRRPGWIVLWRGWAKLQNMMHGYDAALTKKCGKT
jgi:hypothetical protein